MTSNKRKYVKPTAEDLKIIEDCTRRSVFERLEAGEVEIVDFDDWSGITEEPEESKVTLLKTLYRKLQTASKKLRTSPDRLAAKWISECLGSKRL